MILLALLLVLSLVANFAVVSAQAFAYQQPSQLQGRISEACKLLKTLYNPTLGLVRETLGSQTYYIASDNLLTQKALESCDPQMAASIRTIIATCCGNGYSMMHEALLEVEIPLPIRTATIYTIANSSAGPLFNGVQPSLAGGKLHRILGSTQPDRNTLHI